MGSDAPAAAEAGESTMVVRYVEGLEPGPSERQTKRQHKKAGSRALKQVKTLKRHHATMQRLHAALSDAESPSLDRQGSSFYYPESACGSRATPLRFVWATAKMLLMWFEDEDVEREYRYFAFAPNVMRLAHYLYLGAALYSAIVIFDLIWGPKASTSADERGLAIGVRLSLVGLTLATGGALTQLRLAPRTSALVILSLLVVGGLLPTYLVPRSAHFVASDETYEQTFAGLIGFAVLVPPLQLRYVALAMGPVLTTLHLSLALTTSLGAHQPNLSYFLVARAACKDLVLIVTGMSLAVAAEAQNRFNFTRARLFLEQQDAMAAVRNDMHRLLLNTLPAPIVRDIARGHTEVAHRYTDVTVLQASALRVPSEYPPSTLRVPSEYPPSTLLACHPSAIASARHSRT